MAVWDVAVRPAQEQFGYWREVICEAFVPLAPAPLVPWRASVAGSKPARTPES